MRCAWAGCIRAVRGLVAFAWCRRYHAFDHCFFLVGREGAFFLYQLNVHTFNCRHGADRRVEGGFKEWVVKPRFYKDFVFKVGGV